MRYIETPRPIRFTAATIALNLILFSVLRLAFLWAFNSPEDPLGPLLWKSLYIGFKFDLRLAVIINMPLMLTWVWFISPYDKRSGSWLWGAYLIVVNLLVLITYIFDFGFYAYLNLRLDATALRFLLNPLISMRMIWETYPVIPITLAVVAFIILYVFVIIRLTKKMSTSMVITASRLKRGTLYTVALLLCIAAIYGKFSFYPLRWSDAFFSSHPFSSALATNPVLNLVETLKKHKRKPFDTALVKKHYPLISYYLGVDRPDPESLSFIREVARPLERKTPNVVIVLLESFSHYKLGSFDNPLDPTPNFDALSRKGLLFKRFYTPHSGTARSVFTTITGLPDVETDRTASRNPMVVRQHTIVDAFKGYEKFYFLGGSLNWANIRGLLMRNIEGLEIHEEGSYRAPRVDVWGISDLHLFEEANNIIREKQKPFFAIIQTSGNHRPYTIPEDNRGFRLRKEDEKRIKDAGFISEEEFNSFRFMDHAIGHFIKQAKKEKYFANTIFVFYGDHGLPGHARHMNRAEDQLTLTTFHVPLLIYAPGLLKGGQVDDKPASEVDVMPTIASLAGIPYLNNTLGRNLLDPKFAGRRYAFTMYHFPAMPQIGVIGEEFVLTMNADGTRRRLHDYHSDSPRENVESMHPGEADKMEALALGLHETAKYLLYNNRPENFR
ncbi:hypothetical protein LCGC14_1558970 [marine sediment metagenome]|uniref:Sulfatase N-terminal domain-containing protein n=1 Tax=marine sediment metagenome TaxID=412755 RepID=A0A0F9IN42_9ZZZZ